MKKNRFLLFLGVVAFLFVTSLHQSYSNKLYSVSTDRTNYSEGNSEEVRKMYVEVSEGSIKNKYTKDNPLIMTINETMYFHMAFNEDEYADMKQNAVSAVYSVEDGTILSNAVARVANDQFFDEFNGIRFAFKGSTTGDCRIVIKNKNDDSEIYETMYVRVYPANTIRFKDRLMNRNVDNPRDVTVDTGEELEFSAVLLGNLVMNGDKPSEENFVGSGFWSWNVPVTNEWTKLENNKWLTTYKITTEGPGDFTIGLGRNGAGDVGSVNVHVVQNKMEVDKIVLGTKEYNNINKNIATKMLNGFNKGDNSASNRYPIYIGDEIKINAPVGEGYTYALTNSNTLSVKEETSFKNNTLSVTYLATNPGNNEIQLKDANGNVTETFYVQVHYPFYVNTGIGEIHENTIHEYLDYALSDFYNAHKDAVVSSPDGVPQYVKNGRDYYMFYYVFGDNTVTVSTYLSQNDSSDISIEGDLDMSNKKVENVTSGSKAGFKKITATFAVNRTESGGQVMIGSDKFVIAQRTASEKVHHFDLETADGGSCRRTETVTYIDGHVIETETLYSTKIADIHGSKAYSSDGTLLIEVPKKEYWLTYPEESTQFESTSAYKTNDAGHLIDWNNRVIDDAFRAGLAQPIVMSRNVQLTSIEKVDFNVDVVLIPISKTKKHYKKNDEGELELVDTENINVSSNDTERVNGYNVTMSGTHIVDAYNKCPYHSGLDFTLKMSIVEEKNSDEAFVNPETSVDSSIYTSIVLMIVSIITLLGLSNLKRKVSNR